MAGAPQYRELMTAIIRRFITIVGTRTALEAARRVPGVIVTEGGIVTSNADLGTLTGLVAEYKRIGGSLSVHFMRHEVAPLVQGTNLPLPDDLK